MTHVLIIEDDPAVRSSLKFALEVEVFLALAHQTRAELLKDRYPQDGCLIVDYKLPDMNGLDLIVELRRRKIELPAILITTHPSAAVRDRAARAGVPLIEKPLRPRPRRTPSVVLMHLKSEWPRLRYSL